MNLSGYIIRRRQPRINRRSDWSGDTTVSQVPPKQQVTEVVRTPRGLRINTVTGAGRPRTYSAVPK